MRSCPIQQISLCRCGRSVNIRGLAARMPESWQTLDGGDVALDLQGFRYDRLGGMDGFSDGDLASVDVEALIAWVRSTASPDGQGYSPQPYLALETALSNMGAQVAAREVAFARLLHRAQTREGWLSWTWDQVLRYTVGFGVKPGRALAIFVAMVAIGTVLAVSNEQVCKWRSSPAAKSSWIRQRWDATLGEWADALFYSLENAIPLMEPSADHATVEHRHGLIRAFFHVQKVLGFLLATVLIGSMTLGG